MGATGNYQLLLLYNSPATHAQILYQRSPFVFDTAGAIGFSIKLFIIVI